MQLNFSNIYRFDWAEFAPLMMVQSYKTIFHLVSGKFIFRYKILFAGDVLAVSSNRIFKLL